jgi:hypothetical protein
MAITEDEPGFQILIFIVGSAIGALVVGLVWWGFAENSPDVANDDSRQPAQGQGAATSADAHDGPLAGSASPRPVISRLDSCEQVYSAQTEPLGAVEPAMSQWEVHIGAMNKLVTGQISLRQATQFWNHTRVRAQQHLQQFARARRTFDQRTVRCPLPRDMASLAPELRNCTRAVAARARTLHTATVALQTWRVHARHMEMLRHGEMTPEEATRLWLRNWHRGNREVQAYHAARRATKGSTNRC